MAIDNEQNQRSVAPLPFWTVYPLEDGGIDSADQLHFTWVYREVLAPVVTTLPPTTFSREEVHVIALTIKGTISGEQIFYFSPKQAPPVNLQLGLDVRPYSLGGSIGGRPTRIEPDKGVTQRASVSLPFAEDDNAPDFDSAVFTIFKGGAFWRRLVRAQPDFIGSTVEVKRGFLPLTTFAAMATIFKGRLEKIDFSSDETVTLGAKDSLILQDVLLPSKVSDSNTLTNTINAANVTITITDTDEVTDPVSLPSKDFFPVTIRLTPDSIPFLVTSASWTASSRIITETGSFLGYVHRPGDQIFLSHASITDGLFTIAAKLSDNAIQIEEEIFASDLTTVASRPQEDVIISEITSSTVLTVQNNFMDHSEDFTDAVWVKTGGTTVLADQEIGPFGGGARGDLISFAATNDSIKQISGQTSGGIDWDGSVWLKRDPAASADETITIEIAKADASVVEQLTVTVTKDWQRFDVTKLLSATSTVDFRIIRLAGDAQNVLAFGAQVERASSRGFYAATTTVPALVAGRLAFGSVSAGTHPAGTKIAEVLTYRSRLNPESGIHAVVAVRDLVNRLGIAAADVDQASFDLEFDLLPGSLVKKAGFTSIRKPKRGREIMSALRIQTMLDLWVSEKGLVTTRFNFRQTLPGGTVKALTHEDNILFGTLAVRNNEGTRITRIFVSFDPFRDDPGKEPDKFVSTFGKVLKSVETPSGIKARRIFADWLFQEGDAISLAGRLLGRFKRGARLVSADLDLSDEPDFLVGDQVTIDSPDILIDGASGSAVRGTTRWQVTERRHKRLEGRVGFEALEQSGQTYGHISPDDDLSGGAGPFPDFPAASDAERQYGFIGDAQNKIARALTTAPFTLVSATYTAATKRIFEVGVFASYTFANGDAFFPVHSSAHDAFYLIASKIDNDTIELSEAIKNVTDGFTDSGDLTGLKNDTAKFREQLVDGYVLL